ncbi:MAG TPA: PEP-CTERM sorting domain-containing protein, partial [Tepidisphaeraceae bacterium]
NSVTISNLINAGHYLPGANSTTYVAGTITNIGSFDINPGSGFSSELKVSTGTLMLNGGGEVVLNSHPAALDAALTGFVDTTLVNADNRIHGTGRCGGDFLDIVNQSNGIIDADIAGQQLLVDPDPIIVNNGVIRATNGGRLTLTDGQVTNNGSIQAQNNSRVEIARQTIVTGGVFTTSGSGTIHVSGDASFTNVTNNGNIIIGVPAGSGGVGLFLNGTIDNTGSLNVAASNTDSLLFVQDDTMLIGSGIVNLNDTDGGTPRSQIDGTFGKTLTNVNNTLQGVGFIGNNSIGIINQGTIIASGGTLTLDAIQAGSLINSGMLRATSGGALILTGNDRINFGTFASTGGAMDVQSGGTLVIDDFATLTAGTIVLNGAWKHDGLSTATATNFRGTGSLNLVQGVVSVNANGGDIGTSRLKQLTITTTSGLLDLNDNDLIVDYDAADPLPTLQAYIANARNGGAWNGNGITSSSAKDHPQHATTLGIISAADYFASHGPGSTFDGQAIDASTNLIKYTWYGDTDFNGRVNFDDYVRADNGFNNHLTGWFNGDFDLNGSVNFDDYVLIDLAFNSQSGTLQRALSFLDGSDPSSREMDEPALRRIRQHLDRFGPDYAQHVLAAVPEPASIAGLGLISTFGLARRRRGAKVN